MSDRVARLQDVADLNPSLDDLPARDEPVSFLPMAAVDADVVDAVDTEMRPFHEVSKGYTPFVVGDVLVAKITPCFENGKIAHARPRQRVGYGSTEFHVVRTHAGKLEARYLVHFLRQGQVRREGEQRMTGSAGQRRVPEHFLANIKIPLPPLPEQRRIAAILDKADALRAKRRAALAQLDTLTQSIFLEMFGDPTTNPKRWEIVQLGELLRTGPQNGLYRPASDYGTGTPILRIDGFYDGSVTNFATLKRVRIPADDVSRYGLHPGDVVINRVNSREYLGKSALIPDLAEPTVFESNMMRLGVDNRRLSAVYLIHFLQTGHVRGHINRAAKDAINQSSINQQDVRSIQVPLPPPAQQERFTHYVHGLQALGRQLRAAGADLDALFASLQHRAFRGEL